MYFSDNPADRYYERMMVGVPNFKPRGHGVVFVGSRPTEPLLVKAPLSFGNEGYIAFDDDTSPNFLGYELTPTEFMETGFTKSEDEDIDEDETQTIQMGGISQ